MEKKAKQKTRFFLKIALEKVFLKREFFSLAFFKKN
jgi:hypothetical protein